MITLINLSLQSVMLVLLMLFPWVTHMGPGALLAKYGIKLAFRLLSVHPDDFDLLAVVTQLVLYQNK